MYRDFVYMDTDRIQSIVAQLQKGALEKVMEGKTTEWEGKAGVTGVLASLLPFEAGGAVAGTREVQSSKVLHDYAYTVALESLQEAELCLEVDDWERDALPLPDAAFVLARGSMVILDYELLQNMATHEKDLTRLFSTGGTAPQSKSRSGASRGKAATGAFRGIGSFVTIFMGDAVQVRMQCAQDVLFAGPLSRSFLRETTRDLIYKYGGKGREGWTMLAQVCQVTEPMDKLASMGALLEEIGATQPNGGPTVASESMDSIVAALNALQEAMASAAYPAVAVTPIALYRELGPLK